MGCCHVLLRTIQFTAVTAAVLLSGSHAFAVDGPSFDCSHGVRQTLAVILCMSPEAAQADWDVNRAYWALFTDDREETTFNEAVNQRCAISTPQLVTEQHVRCVINAFHKRAAALRNRLTGNALAESNLSPDDHVDIQVALAGKGFLQNRVRGYGANADGQFGPNTRSAIKDFQRSIGAQAAGFLSNEQRLALAESTEEREARAAQEKARQEALEAQKHAGERAKQAEIDRERKRLEDEAEKAAEWRRRIDQAQKKGPEYADKVPDLKWSLQESTNPKSDEHDYTVSSRQTNGTGALAAVDGACLKDQVLFGATLHDADDSRIPLGFSKSSAGGIIGNKRINDDSVFATNFPLDKWSNRIVVSRQSFRQDDPESADTTWRVLAEIETSRGTLYIKIPTLDAKIQKLIATCKHHYEIEKRRQGSPNTPG
jgi:peptidoglycan hydrolase-like protein with peptidoglycan-binding domain